MAYIDGKEILFSANVNMAEGLDETAANNNFANAIKGNKVGHVVVLDDASPLPHNVQVSVESKNLVPLKYYNSNGKTFAGVTFTINADMSLTLNGAFDGTMDNVVFYLFNSATNPLILKKGTYIGGTGVGYASLSYMRAGTGTGRYGDFGTPQTFEQDTGIEYLYISMRKDKLTGKVFENETIYPMLMRGTTVEEYTEPVPIDTEVAVTYGAQAEVYDTEVGTNFGIVGLSQGDTIQTDNEGVVVYVEYNKDTNKVIENLVNAIISLGGNV